MKILLILEKLLPHFINLYRELRENHKDVKTKSIEEIVASSNDDWDDVERVAKEQLEGPDS